MFHEGRSIGTHHAKKAMVKGICAVSVRLFWSTALLAAVSGCGHVPVWINGKYYGPSDQAAAQPVVVTPPPPPQPKIILKPQTPPPPQAQVDPALSQELEQVYQNLLALTPEDAHGDLAQEQYDWRTRRTILCNQGGQFNAQCGNEITYERIAELSARVDALSRPGASVPGGVSPTLPPSVQESVASLRLSSSVPQGAASQQRPSAPQGAAPPTLPPSVQASVASLRLSPSAPQGAAPPTLPSSVQESVASLRLSPSAPTGAAPPPLPPPVQERAAASRLPSPAPESAVARPLPPPAPSAASPVAAHAGTYTVAATAMPWVWKTGGLNSSYEYGLQDGSAPTVVPLASLGAQPGQGLMIRYVGGHIALGAGGPKADGLGYAGQNDHGGNGITGRKLPSAFMQPYPINLGSLVGVFTDKNGGIVGAPFAIGNGAVRKQVPPGASQIQLGVNDDIYGAANAGTGNSGSFTVEVSPGQS